MTNFILISFRLPQNMWEKAILSINYLLNKVPHKKEEKPLMSYKKEDNLFINSFKCRGVLPKWMYQHKRR